MNMLETSLTKCIAPQDTRLGYKTCYQVNKPCLQLWKSTLEWCACTQDIDTFQLRFVAQLFHSLTSRSIKPIITNGPTRHFDNKVLSVSLNYLGALSRLPLWFIWVYCYYYARFQAVNSKNDHKRYCTLGVKLHQIENNMFIFIALPFLSIDKLFWCHREEVLLGLLMEILATTRVSMKECK